MNTPEGQQSQESETKEHIMSQPILWGQEHCGPCKQIARKYETSGVDYEYRDVQDLQWAEQVEQLREQGYTGTPIVQTPTETFQGLQPDKIQASITEAQAQQQSRLVEQTSTTGPSVT